MTTIYFPFSSPYSYITPLFDTRIQTLSDRGACVAAAPPLPALGCASTSPAAGLRSYLWSEGLLGSFQCAASKTTSVGRPLSSCVVRFTPRVDAEASTQVPPVFAVHVSLPNARSAAVAWRVRTLVFNESGTLVSGASQLLQSNMHKTILVECRQF